MSASIYTSFTNFVYVRLTQVIWVFNGLASLNNLPKNSGDYLKDLFENVEKEKPLIIDCKRVADVIDHSWDDLFKSIQSINRTVVFINYEALENKIAKAHSEFCSARNFQKNGLLISINQGKFEFTDDNNRRD